MMEKLDCLLPLQSALFSKLTTTLPYGVYDSPPDNAQFPYIVIGDDSASDIGTKVDHGDEVVSTFHVWSRANGLTEAKTIMGEVLGLLTRAPVNILNFQVKFQRMIYSSVTNDPDGITRHGVLRISLKMFQTD